MTQARRGTRAYRRGLVKALPFLSPRRRSQRANGWSIWPLSLLTWTRRVGLLDKTRTPDGKRLRSDGSGQREGRRPWCGPGQGG